MQDNRELKWHRELVDMADVFISYQRRSSSALALLIKQQLEARTITAVVDVTDMDSPGILRDKLREHIAQSSVFVCLLGATTLNSRYVLDEIDHAIELNKPLIPVIQESFAEIDNQGNMNVNELLKWQGLRVLDTTGQLIPETIEKLGDMIVEILAARGFATTLAQQMALMGKMIDRLTDEQYKTIARMRFVRRVAVAGCAGSGKTLVAIQKGIDLDRVGERTMILCHSRLLAEYIKGLVKYTAITVVDFSTWVQQINGQITSSEQSWTYYEEPTEQELDSAIDLVRQGEKFDAIIVDEGQDFRLKWWELVETALQKESGRLYIFHDDNQALLPNRATYPAVDMSLTLSRNCRNAGRIFDLVRRLYLADIIEPSQDLLEKGFVKNWASQTNDVSDVVSRALSEAFQYLPENKIVLLTTEPDPVEESRFYEHEIVIHPKWRWQDVVHNYMRSSQAELILSNELRPTLQDIELVVQYAKKRYRGILARSGHRGTSSPKYGDPLYVINKYNINWYSTDDNLFLKNVKKSMGYRVFAFFSSQEWADQLPHPRKIRITTGHIKSDNSISLYSIASFKGLESDGVILYIPSYRANLEADLYVGISRAKYMLYIVTDKSVFGRIRQFLE